MTSFNKVDEYINSLNGLVKEYLNQIRAIVKASVPESTELINYGILAFSLVEGGKRDQQIMIAAYKNHVGFYPHPDTIKHFHKQLQAYKSSKGSVQFRLDKPLPERLIEEMVLFRYKKLNNE